MPCTDDFYLGDHYWKEMKFDERAAYRKWLNTIVEAVVASVPVAMQPGTMRWARAFGMV